MPTPEELFTKLNGGDKFFLSEIHSSLTKLTLLTILTLINCDLHYEQYHSCS